MAITPVSCPIRITLEELGHPQPPRPSGLTTAVGIATDSIKQKHSKAIDMRFYWGRDRVRQGQHLIYWRTGRQKKADYFTKHDPSAHLQAIRSSYLYSPHQQGPNYFEFLSDKDGDTQPSPKTD